MHIHVISPLKENSGWGQAGRDWILALDSTKNKISARPFLMSNPNYKLDGRLKEICEEDAFNADVVIQHLPPFLMSINDLPKKNIGMFVTDCSHFNHSKWTKTLNLMSEVWIPCEFNRMACQRSRIKVPTKIVHHACNLERYGKSLPHIPHIKNLKDEGRFIFYTICDFNPRKNLESIIRAFYTEFNYSDQVALVIKISSEFAKNGHLQVITNDLVNKTISQTGIRKRSCPIQIISDYLTDDEILGLHAEGDCFVQSSFSESHSIPAFDAMAMGKTPIVPAHSGYLEYINDNTGWPVKSNIGYANNLGFSDFSPMTSDVEIGVIDEVEFGCTMRRVYEEVDLRKEKAEFGVEEAFKFSYAKVGQDMIAHIKEGLD